MLGVPSTNVPLPILVIFIYSYSSLCFSYFAVALDEVFLVVPRVNPFTGDLYFFAFELGSPLNYYFR